MHPAHPRLWHAAMCRTNLQVAAVDLIDYFQMTGQQMSKQFDWPALQSFRENRVIGVGTGSHTDVPGLTISSRTLGLVNRKINKFWADIHPASLHCHHHQGNDRHQASNTAVTVGKFLTPPPCWKNRSLLLFCDLIDQQLLLNSLICSSLFVLFALPAAELCFFCLVECPHLLQLY